MTDKVYLTEYKLEDFIGTKEILKWMPELYNNLYFTSDIGEIFTGLDTQKTIDNIIGLTDINNLDKIEKIIKENFIDIEGSTNNQETKKYGLTIKVGNYKINIGTYEISKDDIKVRFYDYVDDSYKEVKIPKNDSFLYYSVNEMGESLNTCSFSKKDMTNSNTKIMKIKNDDVILSNSGAISQSLIAVILIVITVILALIIAYNLLI